MMQVREIELDDVGNIVAMKGTASRTIFSVITDKTIFWAEFELDYCGG